MDLVKARASARVSLAEYERLQQLNRDGKNASDKAVEAARAASESDTAVAQNVAEALAILKSSIALRWGPALASWLEQGSPRLNALLAQRMFLLQVTSMNGGLQAAPRQAIVRFADGTHTSAQLISLLPQLDQRLQTPSFLYLAPAHSGLIAGMNLPVFLTAGAARGGVLVPISAAVWWQGKAWCYVELSPGKFTREQVSTVNPLDSGWFVTEGIAPRTRVVISGAQTLLSEEFRSQIQTDED
jgi:hypothetical protein